MGRSEIDSEIARGVIRRTVDLCNGGGGVSVHKSKGESARELHKITAKLLKGLPRGIGGESSQFLAAAAARFSRELGNGGEKRQLGLGDGYGGCSVA